MSGVENAILELAVSPVPSSIAISPYWFAGPRSCTLSTVTSRPSYPSPESEHEVPIAPVVVTRGTKMAPIETMVMLDVFDLGDQETRPQLDGRAQ